MRIGIQASYSGGFRETAAEIRELESAGLDLATVADGQLYTVLGALGDDGRWQLRLWWKPWVTLIWLGGALIALGGVLSLVGHVLRDRRRSVAA